VTDIASRSRAKDAERKRVKNSNNLVFISKRKMISYVYIRVYDIHTKNNK